MLRSDKQAFVGGGGGGGGRTVNDFPRTELLQKTLLQNRTINK